MTEAVTITLMTEDQKKKAFALAFLRMPDEPFKAAASVFPNAGEAMLAGTLWVSDPLVKKYQMEALEQYGSAPFLPTEVDELKGIWEIANDKKTDADVRLKAYELYEKVRRGYFNKPDVINQTNILNQGVMVIKDKGTDADWERGLTNQQEGLVRNA